MKFQHFLSAYKQFRHNRLFQSSVVSLNYTENPHLLMTTNRTVLFIKKKRKKSIYRNNDWTFREKKKKVQIKHRQAVNPHILSRIFKNRSIGAFSLAEKLLSKKTTSHWRRD